MLHESVSAFQQRRSRDLVVVAATIAINAERSRRSQLIAVVIGAVAFVFFGVSDLLELPTAGQLPAWLWGFKIFCGTLIFVARYTWRGWSQFRWRDREVVFGLSCLVAVSVVMSVQWYLT